MKVLLIEDIRTERKIIKRWLEKIDCVVIEAADGNEGLSLYRDNIPDLVITDIVMPEKEGLELMMELRREFPDVKIFAISGAGQNVPGEYLSLAEALGSERTFIKPIDKGKLLDAVLEFSPKADLNGN